MSISTYAELQTSVATWLHRSDLTANIVDFITLAEKRLNRRLRLLAMETVVTPTLSAAATSVDFPDRFLEHIDLRYQQYDYRPTQISVRELSSLTDDDQGQPNYFAISSKYEFNRPSDQDYTMIITYFKGFDIAADNTNWLLTNAPDAYLYATLLEAGAFIKDASRLQTWSSGLEQSIKDLNQKDAKSRSQVVVRVDNGLNPAYNRSGNFDIRRGY